MLYSKRDEGVAYLEERRRLRELEPTFLSVVKDLKFSPAETYRPRWTQAQSEAIEQLRKKLTGG